MRMQIPTTQALVAFEAVARYLNATHAAQELCLTPGAVCKQLQSLEDRLRVKLFSRGPHGLALTPWGQRFLDRIKPALVQLDEACQRAASERIYQKELRLRVTPAFADRWLLPRYLEFARANPDLKVHIDANALRDENLLGSYDLLVRSGNGSWPGYTADYLCGSQRIIVASPDLLAQGPGIREPADLARYELYEHAWTPTGWSMAFETLGVEAEPASPVVQWDFWSAIIRSAQVGLGLSLVPKCFVTRELADGSLVQVLDYCQYVPFSYYLVVLETRQDDPSIARFRGWLKSKQFDGEDRPLGVRTGPA